jgi:hypothetical protein
MNASNERAECRCDLTVMDLIADENVKAMMITMMMML